MSNPPTPLHRTELSLARRSGVLNVSGRGLSELPFDASDVRGVTHLNLGSNRFIAIPGEVLKMRDLEILRLDRNQISEVSTDIANLTKLQELDLDGNQLRQLPMELAPLLRVGLSISLAGNPLLAAYPEILHRSGDALASYLESLADGELQYEAKILVVGEGNVGKTSLVAALRGEPFVTNRPTTHGPRWRVRPPEAVPRADRAGVPTRCQVAKVAKPVAKTLRDERDSLRRVGRRSRPELRKRDCPQRTRRLSRCS